MLETKLLPKHQASMDSTASNLLAPDSKSIGRVLDAIQAKIRGEPEKDQKKEVEQQVSYS